VCKRAAGLLGFPPKTQYALTVELLLEATGPTAGTIALPRKATTVAAGENIRKYGTSATHGVHLIISVAMRYTPPLQAIVSHS